MTLAADAVWEAAGDELHTSPIPAEVICSETQSRND